MNDILKQVREAHKKVAKVSNGMIAWIVRAEWGYGVRFYPINAGYVGMIEKVEYGGDIELIERLIKR